MQDNAGQDYSAACGVLFLNSMATSVNSKDTVPDEFTLHVNFPNPFNPTTTISYTLASPGRVKLEIYNQLGQAIKTLVDRNQDARLHQVLWDGRNNEGKQVVSGVYFYRLHFGTNQKSGKMILLQ